MRLERHQHRNWLQALWRWRLTLIGCHPYEPTRIRVDAHVPVYLPLEDPDSHTLLSIMQPAYQKGCAPRPHEAYWIFGRNSNPPEMVPDDDPRTRYQAELWADVNR